jgi:MtaA/CmuA family methyltransferase
MSLNKIISFQKVMVFEEVEEVPAIPSVSGWVNRFSGLPLKHLFYDSEAIVRAQIHAQKTVGYDALFAYTDALYIPEAFGCPIVFRPSGVDVSPLEIENEEDVNAIPIPNIRRDGRLPLLLDVAEQLAKWPGREVPVLSLFEGPFTTSCRIMGTERMMRALYKNRRIVERMLETVSQLLLNFGRALEEASIDGLMIADPVSSSMMISAKFYREFAFPHLQRLIKSLKLPVILHVCGDTQPILHLMAETGARILSLDQCMDLSIAKQIVAGRCGIGGNVDPIHALLLGTPEEVKRETLRCLNQGGKKGFILMAGCAVPPGTPKENLRAMIEVARCQS